MRLLFISKIGCKTKKECKKQKKAAKKSKKNKKKNKKAHKKHYKSIGIRVCVMKVIARVFHAT